MNTRVESLLSNVRQGVQNKMEETILDGGTRFCYEKKVGTAWIVIDFQEVCSGAFLSAYFDIEVAHEDAHKRSTTLERALFAVMPDWFKTKEVLQPSA